MENYKYSKDAKKILQISTKTLFNCKNIGRINCKKDDFGKLMFDVNSYNPYIYKEDVLNFNLDQPEICYLLGFFWADSHFKQTEKVLKKNSKGNLRGDKIFNRNFSFEIKKDDFDNIKDILIKFGFDKFSYRKRERGQLLGRVRSSSSYLSKFQELGFGDKYSSCLVYFRIKDENKGFFIKGFLDGDGSVCNDNRNGLRVLFYGKSFQYWGFLEDFLSKHNIQYSVNNYSRKSKYTQHKKSVHSWSILRIKTSKKSKEFCDILENYNIGLRRKLDIASNITY